MKYVYVFACTANSKLLAFTCKKKYLPSHVCNGEWYLWNEAVISKESERTLGANAREILDGIEEKGYFLLSATFEFYDAPEKVKS